MHVCTPCRPDVKMNSETNEGTRRFVYKDNKFREYYRKRNRNVCFRCTVKTCKERIETNDVIIIVGEYGDHDHSNKASNVAAVALRVSCKHKASKDISQRPSKIIRTDFAPGLWAASPQQSPTTTNAAESFHSHLNADIRGVYTLSLIHI